MFIASTSKPSRIGIIMKSLKYDLYIANTELQLFCIINLAKANVGNQSILLLNRSRAGLNIFSKYQLSLIKDIFLQINFFRSSIFKKDISQFKIKLPIKILDFLFCKIEFFRLLSFNLKEINDMYIGSGLNGNYFTNNLYYKIYKNGIKFNIIDDGISTQIVKETELNSVTIFSKLLKFKYLNIFDSENIFILNKTIFFGDNKIKNKLMGIKIQYLDLVEQKSFSIFNEYFDQIQIIILDNYDFLKINLGINDSKIFLKYKSSFKSVYDQKDLDFSIPWEFISKNLEKGTILFTGHSAASITPIVLYQKVKAIILYKLINENPRPEVIDFFNNLSLIYPDSIFIPETIEELKSIVYKYIG